MAKRKKKVRRKKTPTKGKPTNGYTPKDGDITLLDVESLPPLSGVVNDLANLLKIDHDSYKSVIMMISRGVFPPIAAETIGILPDTFHEWYTTGVQEAISGLDTLHSRFALDIRRSLAHARATVEESLHSSDKKFWLTRGPGNWLGEEWKAPEKKETVTHEGGIDHAIIHTGRVTHGHLHIEGQDLSDVLKELSNAGLIETNERTDVILEASTSNVLGTREEEDAIEEDVLKAIEED